MWVFPGSDFCYKYTLRLFSSATSSSMTNSLGRIRSSWLAVCTMRRQECRLELYRFGLFCPSLIEFFMFGWAMLVPGSPLTPSEQIATASRIYSRFLSGYLISIATHGLLSYSQEPTKACGFSASCLVLSRTKSSDNFLVFRLPPAHLSHNLRFGWQTRWITKRYLSMQALV